MGCGGKWFEMKKGRPQTCQHVGGPLKAGQGSAGQGRAGPGRAAQDMAGQSRAMQAGHGQAVHRVLEMAGQDREVCKT